MHTLCLLSGGLDSFAVAASLSRQGDQVTLICFDYGQRNAKEIEAAVDQADFMELPLEIVDLGFVPGIVNSQLTGAAPESVRKDLPPTYVPNRNLLFYTVAHAYAQKIGADRVAVAIHAAPHSSPDAELPLVTKFFKVLNEGSNSNIDVYAPMASEPKSMMFALAQRWGFINEALEMTITCYHPNPKRVYPWGRGCGECKSCKERAQAYEGYLLHLGKIYGGTYI